MLAFGIIEFSTAYNRTQGMQAAAREGARFASTGDVASSAVATRVRSTLQADDNGAGFPDPGGSGTVPGDIDVRVYSLTQAEFALLSDGFDPGDPTGTLLTSTVACNSTTPGTFGVRIVTDVYPAHRDAYGLTLPLIPGSPFDLALQAEAIFRCI